MTSDHLLGLARMVLAEDAPAGDLTTALVVPEHSTSAAEIRVRESGVLAGTPAAGAVFTAAAEDADLGPVELGWKAGDGDAVGGGDVAATVHGPTRAILRAERPALNLLGHLSGVATLTRRFVEAAGPATVLCTRKTLPGLRALERDAVVAGGGSLHRASLSDAILVKDNHVRAAGSVGEAVRRAKRANLPVEAEAETLEEVDEALAAGADRILLDNPNPRLVAQAAARIGDPQRLEISGGVTLESLPALVAAGARLVSVGRLTHSAPALDLSLEVIDVG